ITPRERNTAPPRLAAADPALIAVKCTLTEQAGNSYSIVLYSHRASTGIDAKSGSPEVESAAPPKRSPIPNEVNYEKTCNDSSGVEPACLRGSVCHHRARGIPPRTRCSSKR